MKDRLKGEAGRLLEKYFNEEWYSNPLYNNIAQAIENVYSFEQVPIYAQELIDLLKEHPEPPIIPPSTLTGRGISTVEAPRGLLIHDYTLENGKILRSNIITPTAMNLDDIEKHLFVSAENQIRQGMDDEQIKFNLEMIVRAYDPCISCSAHMVKIKRK